jgi:hypothetical protein
MFFLGVGHKRRRHALPPLSRGRHKIEHFVLVETRRAHELAVNLDCPKIAYGGIPRAPT